MNDGLDSFRLLIRAGVPSEHVHAQLQKHMAALKELPQSFERDEAITATKMLMNEVYGDLTE